MVLLEGKRGCCSPQAMGRSRTSPLQGCGGHPGDSPHLPPSGATGTSRRERGNRWWAGGSGPDSVSWVATGPRALDRAAPLPTLRTQGVVQYSGTRDREPHWGISEILEINLLMYVQLSTAPSGATRGHAQSATEGHLLSKRVDG